MVLGAVLEAIVDRTMLSGEASKHHPERWLKNAFIELHKVFETFDGSMLISLVFGLVDDDSGLVYLINAEHPWSVLYRQGNEPADDCIMHIFVKCVALKKETGPRRFVVVKPEGESKVSCKRVVVCAGLGGAGEGRRRGHGSADALGGRG